MTSPVNSSIKWHAAKNSDKLQYMIKSEELASKIILPDNCTKGAMKKLKIAYNNSLRRYMFLPYGVIVPPRCL